jgi:hypothetical protein
MRIRGFVWRRVGTVYEDAERGTEIELIVYEDGLCKIEDPNEGRSTYGDVESATQYAISAAEYEVEGAKR